MWRRVSCEQPLNTSQSILRLRGNLNQACGVFLRETATWPKGNLVLIPKPGRGTVSESRIPSWQRDTTGRRPPKLWEELSFLHKPPNLAESDVLKMQQLTSDGPPNHSRQLFNHW